MSLFYGHPHLYKIPKLFHMVDMCTNVIICYPIVPCGKAVINVCTPTTYNLVGHILCRFMYKLDGFANCVVVNLYENNKSFVYFNLFAFRHFVLADNIGCTIREMTPTR